MNEVDPTYRGVVIAGFGSPHGDDQAGWLLVERLKRRGGLRAKMVAIREATELLEMLDDCGKLMIVDACRSGGRAGTVMRLQWPDPRIEQHHSHSTHGLGVWSTLRLAEQLGRLPSETYVYGIEIANETFHHDVTREVLAAVEKLEAIIATDLAADGKAPVVGGANGNPTGHCAGGEAIQETFL